MSFIQYHPCHLVAEAEVGMSAVLVGVEVAVVFSIVIVEHLSSSPIDDRTTGRHSALARVGAWSPDRK
eukprot:1729925-Pyramimonas_sp.AAC.1